MMKMMRAQVLTEPYNFDLKEVPTPEITDDEVLVKVKYCGICGSDWGSYTGKYADEVACIPLTTGHEVYGTIEEVGKNAKGLKVGDRVTYDICKPCGTCYHCRIGEPLLCQDFKQIGIHMDGGFAEYVKAPSENVHLFHKKFDESLLGLVEPFTIGVEVNNRAQIGKGDKVLIMGAGPIGICVMQVAKRNGAQVIMTDLVKERLEKAKSMGADKTVLVSEENLEERLDQFTDGEGIPVVVDTVCIPSSFEQAVNLACPAGRVVCLGLKDKPSSICMAEITKKELTIVGSRLNNHCFDEVIEGFEDGSLHPEELMTKAYNYKEIMDALNMIKEHPQDVLKIVLKFED